MFGVTKAIQFCYGHRLLNYNGKCRHLHGHNAIAEIELESETLDDLGMVSDFSEIKEKMSAWINEEIDHVMILNKDDAVIETLKEAGERFKVVDGNPTAEFIAKMIFDQAQSLGFPVVGVKLWETPNSYAEYRR